MTILPTWLRSREARDQWPGLPDAREVGAEHGTRVETLVILSWMLATARPDPM
ncbi:hypothetical protein [Microbacterium sp. Bi128]|uniref:hypothetical protein n=1 Tax=Microbacterium sp. Bi128 TaxID=2821115 RepID=UPI001E4668E6|nr:hypothetical protein [Microbacterium sp. Bi128]